MAKFLFYDDKIINLLLKNEKPSGGAAVQAFGWIKGLKELGHDVSVLTTLTKGEAVKEECKDIKLIPLYDKHKGMRWFRWVYYRLPYIYKQIKTIRPDYLYQGIPCWYSFILGLICYQLDIKYIIRISNDFFVDERFYRRYTKLNGYFLKHGINLAYCILCQNEYQYQLVGKKYPHKLVIKITNPIFVSESRPYAAINNRKYIAWLGLFQYQKNIPLLYDIACALKNEHFIIAGKEETGCDIKTSNYLARLKKLPNVKFIGFINRDEVLPFLSGAKYLLNTSLYEGFSNTFLEAMTVGTPIISSTNVNPDNIISKYDLGIVFTDILDLQLKFASVNSSIYLQMRANVLNYVKESHNYKLLTKYLLNSLRINEDQMPVNNASINKCS